MELNNRLINVQLGEVTRRIEGIEGQSNASRNVVEHYKIQTIDQTIKWQTTLEVVKSLPKFPVEINQYVGCREAAETAMSLYKIQSEQYLIALTILRNKIIGAAYDALTNHGTVLNFQAILSRLDFIYDWILTI